MRCVGHSEVFAITLCEGTVLHLAALITYTMLLHGRVASALLVGPIEPFADCVNADNDIRYPYRTLAFQPMF